MEKYFKKKGRQAKGPFARIPFAIMDSDAFRALKPASALCISDYSEGTLAIIMAI